MASSTAKVNETTLSKEDDVAAVGHQVTVNLGLDVLDGLGVGLEPGNVNLNVEVANVWSGQLNRHISNKYWILNLLQTMASFFMTSKCLATRMSRQPVVVTKIWPRGAASSMVTTW